MITLGTSHKKMAEQLTHLLAPLKEFVDEHKKSVALKKESIDATWKTLDRHRSDTAALCQNYVTKCQVADLEEQEFEKKAKEESVPPMDVMIVIGPLDITVEEFNNTLIKMQKEIPTEVRVASAQRAHAPLGRQDILRNTQRLFPGTACTGIYCQNT